MRIGVLLLIILVFISCQQKEINQQTLNGYWQSLGSGWVLQINDSTEYTLYDVTSISCISNRKAQPSEIINDISFKNDTLQLKKGVMTYLFTRIDSLSHYCKQTMTEDLLNDPLYNFDVFAETVSEHYAFMELNEIQWDSLKQAQRKKLETNPTALNLYQVLDETLEVLNDNHAYLEASNEVYEALENMSKMENEEEEETTSLPEYGDLQIAGMVKDHFLQEEMTKDSKLIQWGKINDTLGYIQVMTMWLHADLKIPQALVDEKGYLDAYVDTFHQMYEGDYIKKEVEAVKSTMNRMMDDLSAMESIIIDVRFNGGGQDAVSFEILNRFTKDKLHIANQQLRYGNQFSPTLPLFLEGSPKAFTKPVYVLTSPQTGSAAEAFAIATMAMPHVKRIGSATSGAMSTALEKSLPNGWAFSISNEIYTDTKGTIYENKGIPVDYELNYPRERQPFFRAVAKDLEKDKKEILTAIENLATN